MSSIDKKLSYLLVEKNDLSTIFQPLKSKLIKYTCFDVSSNFVILGATSGGLYVFKREPCIFLQLVPNKEGPINNISISWDEKLIAFSSLKGVTCVLELLEGSEARLINRSVEHCGSVVTSLVWSKSTNQLYVGDNVGRLSVINVSLFMNKNIFHIPAYMFMKLDSAVVQISCYEDYLLVSTRTRCYICDTIKEKYKQIGTQLREGLYGATFLNSTEGLKIYCARPGSRLWEADIFGNVRSTHQFKKALAVQSVAVIKLEENLLVQKLQSSWPDQSFNFCILVGLFDKYLFTFKSDGIYIFDPKTAEVILWSDHYRDIVDAKCINDIIYLWTSLGQIHSFIITPLNKCLVQLYFQGKYQLCVDVLEKFLDHAKSLPIMSKVTCLIGLKEHLPSISKNTKLSSYLENLILSVKEKQISSNLDSGIFLVDNKHWKKWKLNIKNNKSSKKKTITRSRSLSDLNSVSKKYNNNICKKEQSPALSLPEMDFFVGETNSHDSSNQSCFTPSLAWNVSLSGSFMQQIPFLSLTSPDLIQSTILELGQNVKRKLFMRTKSLQDKWHLIEEKIKFSKDYSATEPLDFEKQKLQSQKNYKNLLTEDDNIEKNIVYVPFNSEEKKKLSIDVSGICNISEKISCGDKSDETIFSLFDKVIEELHKINEFPTSDDFKKAFPFKQYLSSSYIELMKQIFSDSLSHQQITKYLKQFRRYNLIFFENQDHPDLLKKIHKEDDLINDIALSNMILIFSEVLDPKSVLEHIENTNLPCTFFSWSIILDIFQDSAFSFFATKKESPVNYFECPLPFLLNMIFLMLRLEQIESGCHLAVNVNLKLYHISYLIIKLCLHLEFTGIKYQNCIDKCNKLLLNFILCLLNNGSLHLRELVHPETLYHIEFAFLSANKHSVFKCRCNYPIIGSPKIFTKFPQIGELLLSCYLTPFKYFKSVNKTNKNHLLEDKLKSSNSIFSFMNSSETNFDNEFCIDFLFPMPQTNVKINTNIEYFYSKIIILLQTMPELLSTIIKYFLARFSFNYLPFIVQFGRIEDISEVEFRNNLELWKKVFDLYIRLYNGECCLCHYKSGKKVKVEWNKMFLLALRYLGSSETLKIMTLYADEVPSEAIDISFLRLFFLRPLIEEGIEGNLCLINLCYEKLEPNRKCLLPQELNHVNFFDAEIVEDNEDYGNIYTIELDVDSDMCTHCSLILRTDNSIQDEKIRLFRCKHVYHIACLRKAKSLYDCPKCLKMKLKVKK